METELTAEEYEAANAPAIGEEDNENAKADSQTEFDPNVSVLFPEIEDPHEAKVALKGKVGERVKEEFDKRFDEGNPQTAEELMANQEASDQMSEDVDGADKIDLQAALDSDNTKVNPTRFRYNLNNRVAQEILDTYRDEDQGWGGWFADLAGVMVYDSTVGIKGNLTGDDEKQGMLIQSKMITMSTESFKTWFKGYADEMARGPTGGVNQMFLSDLQGFLNSGGYVSIADDNVSKFWGAIDLLGIAHSVKGLKAVGQGFKASRRATKLLKDIGDTPMRTPDSTNIARAKGTEEAEAILEADVVKTYNTEMLVDGAFQKTHTFDVTEALPAGVEQRIMTENYLMQKFNRMFKSGAMGNAVEDLAIAKKAREVGEAGVRQFIKDRVSEKDFSLYKSGIVRVSPRENYVVNAFGTSDGHAFPSEAAAYQKFESVLKSNQSNVKVIPIDKVDESKGFVVVKTDNLNMTGLAPDVARADVIAATQGFWNNVFYKTGLSNSTARDIGGWATESQLGEASINAMSVQKKLFDDVIGKLSNDEFKTFNAYKEIERDDIVRDWRSANDFINDYANQMGKEPSAAQVAAHKAMTEMEMTQWYLRSTSMMRDLVAHGYQGIGMNVGGDIGQWRTAGRKVSPSQLPGDTQIWHNDKEWLLKDIPEADRAKITIFNTKDGFKPPNDAEGLFFHVSNPDDIGLLTPSDAMGVAVSGRRDYSLATHFIVVDGVRKKSIMAGSSGKSTEAAAKQLEDSRVVAVSDMPKAEKDAYIRANNSWNTNVKSLDDFEEFAKTYNWNYKKHAVIGSKKRDQAVIDGNSISDDPVENLTAGQMASTSQIRGENKLLHIGGQVSDHLAPSQSVSLGLDNEIMRLAFEAGTTKSIEGWVKTAIREGYGEAWGLGTAGDKLVDYRRAFMNAKVRPDDMSHTGESGAFATQMEHMRNVIHRRMGEKGPMQTLMETNAKRLQETVFDTFGKQVDLGDPTNALLKIGFQAAFGFFNIFQMPLQAAHAMVIIAASPKAGAKGATMALMFRKMVKETDPEVLKLFNKRMAKHFDIPENEIEDMLEYVRESGRGIIGADIMELGGRQIESGAKRGFKKAVSKANDVGLAPFNWGERQNQLSGLFTSILEFKLDNPGVLLRGNMKARRSIARRDADLTFNMTNMGRSWAQDDWRKVPTQWLSYTMRSFEALFVGRGFTLAERGQMLIAMGPMYGMAGFGIDAMMPGTSEHIAEKFGWEPNDVKYTFLKWGMIDGMLDLLMPDDEEGKVGIGIANRMSVMGGVVETYRKMEEGNFWEIVGGPSGSIAKGAWDSVMGFMAVAAGDQTVSLTDAAMKILRQPSALDNYAKAYGILMYGNYLTKNGKPAPLKFSTIEGVAQAMGVSPLKLQNYYAAQTAVYRNDKDLREFRTEINTLAERLMLKDRTTDEGMRVATEQLNALVLKVQTSPFSIQQKESLMRSIATRGELANIKLIKSLIKAGYANWAKIVAEQGKAN